LVLSGFLEKTKTGSYLILKIFKDDYWEFSGFQDSETGGY
jgi:hypothetical protein